MTKINTLVQKSKKVRLDVLDLVRSAGKGHIGGTFSCVEILVTLYMGKILNFNPKKPDWHNRDRFILSKGHACLALYSIFKDLGIISEKLYNSYGKDGGLGGQLDTSIAGVDFNTGSLGHSIGVAAGMAFAGKSNKNKYIVYTLIGDSELYEGSSWEAIIFAGDQKIKNLVVIIDRNRYMVTDRLEDNAIYKDFDVTIKKMGWNFFEIKNGHDFSEIIKVLKKASSSKDPAMVIANTIKGKGVSFMENGLDWYIKSPSEEEYLRAKKELLSLI